MSVNDNDTEAALTLCLLVLQITLYAVASWVNNPVVQWPAFVLAVLITPFVLGLAIEFGKKQRDQERQNLQSLAGLARRMKDEPWMN